MKKIEIDKDSIGITYKMSTFIVDGYIEDYSLNSKDEKSFLDLIDNKGYVDEKGRIFIYKEIAPEKKSIFAYIPWFTVCKNDDGSMKYEFSERRLKDVDERFNIKNVGDYSFKKIASTIKEDETLYNEKILNDINSSTSVFRPEIRDEDDFLKKLLKEVILRKDVNIAKYVSKVSEKYILSNMKQGLVNKSKTSAINFLNWTELLGIKFHVIIEDDGTDTDALKEVLHYDNKTDRITSYESMEELIKKLK